MSLNFIAIDFETANAKRASVCQLGVARVTDGVVVKKAVRFVQPPPGFDSFSSRNVEIHGIRKRDVVDGMTWPAALAAIVRYANGLPLVGHNVSVERSVIVQATEAHGLPVPKFEYLCTMDLAKRFMPNAGQFKLDTLSARLGLPSFGHHDAGEDAVACANLALAIAGQAGVGDMRVLWPARTRKY